MAQRARAKFKWDAKDASELSFAAGDMIMVDDQSQEGWWHGTCQGRTGYFPNNYVEIVAGGGGGPPPTRPPSSQAGSSRYASRVSTNASQASNLSHTSAASASSYASSYNSRQPLNPGRGGAVSPSQMSSAGSVKSISSRRAGPPPRGPSSRAISPPAGSPSVQQMPQQKAQAPGYAASQYGDSQYGGSQFNNAPQKFNTPMEDFGLLSDAQWNQRAQQKGRPPMLSTGQRMAAIEQLLVDMRRYSTMFNAGGAGQMPRKGKVGARELAGNALRAVTLYDNNRHHGRTDFDDGFAEKMKKEDNMVSWEASATTDTFARTKYGVFASNMIVITSLALLTFGPLSIYWAIVDPFFEAQFGFFLGIYAIALAPVIWSYEYFKGYERMGNSVLSYRAIVYLLFSVPLWITYPLIPTAIMLLMASVANFLSSARREMNKPMKKRMMQKAQDGSSLSLAFLRESNRLPKLFFVALFLAANIVIFIFAFWETADLNAALPPEEQVSSWGPYAKGFGNMLDFTASIILVPVARTFIRWLYNISTKDQSMVSRFFRTLLLFVPIDKTLSFHKFCAWIIAISTFGHTISHFLNYVERPLQTLALYGLVPWYTGGAVILIMVIMYSAAMKNVKSYHFELFWYTHHLFIGFYILLIIHGNNFIGPNFWKWLLLPGLLYTTERILREYNANKKAVIVSVTFMKPDCFSVRFANKGIFKNGYKEGQYVFINCPYVAKHEWHPFTLSSAPGEEAASLHIRIQNRTDMASMASEKSWTQRVKEYLELLVPSGAVYHEFVSNAGQEIGVIKGPDGQAILKVDGPHSAPTQHVSEYSTAMIVGAGIGVTPLAATMKSIVHYRWRVAVGDAYPNNSHFYWVCSHKDLQAFRWMIRTIKDATDAVWNMRLKDKQNMANRKYHVHCYITSVPKDAQPPPLNSIPGDSVGFWGAKRKDARNIEFTPAPFTEQEMYQMCMAPPKEPTQLCDLVTIHNGRPNWDTAFQEISATHRSNEQIGVAFCGNPLIAHALKVACGKHSNSNANLYFKLHKENF